MIVVDASVAVLGLVDDGQARSVLQAEELVAPHLIDLEVMSALRSQTHRGQIEVEHAGELVRRWSHLGLRRFPISGLLDRVWALRDNLTAYDAAYVALAEALGYALCTADARLAGSPGLRCQVTVVGT